MADFRHARVNRDTFTQQGRFQRLWRSGRRLLPLAILILLLAIPVVQTGSGFGLAVPPALPSSIERDLNGLLGVLGETRRLILVVDVSASMSDPPPGGTAQSKWEIVRRGVAQFLRALPDDTRVGVRVFGHGTAPCGSSKQLRRPEPIGSQGAQDIIRELNRLNPAGDTPLVDTINAAADDLGESGGEIIVLSDGLDTCGGVDLCASAQAIAARRQSLRIDIVATFMDEGAKRAIACVPEATGGVAVNFVGGDPDALGVVLRHVMPVRFTAASLLIVFGGVAFFSLCDLLASALGAVLWRGTAGFVADVVFGIAASLWATFWLTRLTHFPFAVAGILAVALLVFLCRHIPRHRSRAGGESW